MRKNISSEWSVRLKVGCLPYCCWEAAVQTMIDCVKMDVKMMMMIMMMMTMRWCRWLWDYTGRTNWISENLSSENIFLFVRLANPWTGLRCSKLSAFSWTMPSPSTPNNRPGFERRRTCLSVRSLKFVFKFSVVGSF